MRIRRASVPGSSPGRAPARRRGAGERAGRGLAAVCAAAILAAIGLTGCAVISPAGATSSASAISGTGPITFATGEVDTGYVQPLIARWNASHPTQKVTPIYLPDVGGRVRLPEDLLKGELELVPVRGFLSQERQQRHAHCRVPFPAWPAGPAVPASWPCPQCPMVAYGAAVRTVPTCHSGIAR